jgi:formylmethanofuran dehydrogenase subunit C
MKTTPKMPLTLTYTAETTVPVEIEDVTPEAVRELSLDAIRRRQVFHGNRKVELGELFDVAGDPTDLHWEMHGDLSGVHWIGARMREGAIQIDGSAGRHLGSEMHGGQITVSGDAGGWVGSEMHGGTIRVGGSAGHLVGAAYRGSPVGMTGGTILVEGDAGNEIGHSMRRGLIAIGGSCGDLVGFNMLAGTILVFGPCGIRPGAGMRRGTLGLFAEPPPPLLPTFRRACRCAPTALGLIFRHLRDGQFMIDDSLFAAEFEVNNGDFLEGGRGEILVRA